MKFIFQAFSKKLLHSTLSFILISLLLTVTYSNVISLKDNSTFNLNNKNKSLITTNNLELSTKVSLFMAYLHQSSLEITPRCQDKIDFKVGLGHVCFGYFNYNICRKIESFVYQGFNNPAFINVAEINSAKKMLKTLKMHSELYVSIVNKLVEKKFLPQNCISGIVVNSLNPMAELLNDIDDKKNYSVLVLCNNDTQELNRFQEKFKDIYINKLKSSYDYFSIQGLPNNTPFKVKYFAERLMEKMEDNNISLQDDSVIVSDKMDTECKNTKYSNGYRQFMQCLPVKLSHEKHNYLKKDDAETIKDSCCIEMVTNWSQIVNRNTYCFSAKNDYDCEIYAKLLEVSISKNCLIEQAKIYKKQLNTNRNKLKCIFDGSLKLDKLNEGIKYLNLIRFSKFMYDNLKEWRESGQNKVAPIYLAENYKGINEEMTKLVDGSNIGKLLLTDIKDILLELTTDKIEKCKERVKKEVEQGMTGSPDAEISINQDWLRRSSMSVEYAPVDPIGKCDSLVTPRADPMKDFNDMAERINKKEADHHAKTKAEEEARQKAIEQAKKAAEAQKKQQEEEEAIKKEEERRKAQEKAQAGKF